MLSILHVMSNQAKKLFLKVAKLGNIRLAAEESELTPSAVIKAIHRFESERNCKLIQMNGAMPKLTMLGEALLPLAERMLQSEKAIDDCIARFTGQDEDVVTVHCSESFGAYHLPGALVYFSSRHPNLRIECSLRHNNESLQGTLDMRNDLSIVSLSESHAEIDVIPLFSENLVFIVPCDPAYDAIQSGEPWRLNGKPAIVHEKEAFPRRAFEQFLRETGIECPIRMELSNNESIRQSVLAGLGIALVSPAVVRDDVSAKRLRTIEIKHPSMRRSYGIAMHRGRHHTRAVKLFVDSLVAWASDKAS